MADQPHQISLVVPEGTEWPVEGRDPATGDIILRPGFIDAVERASGLEPGSATEDMIGSLLVAWYIERRRAGYPADAVMDALFREDIAEQLGVTPEELPSGLPIIEPDDPGSEN